MEVHQLEYLVALAEEGSFTRAAERLLIAQPSLSQQIQKLEKEIGQPLFDRLPRGVVATEAGQTLLAHARRILAEIQDAKREARERKDQVTGSLAIGAIPTVAPFLLPPVLQTFMARWPDVQVEIREDVTGRLLVELEQGRLDLAVMSAAQTTRSVLLETIATEALLLLLPAAHRLARRRAIAWADIHEERFLVLEEMHCLSDQVMVFCRANRLRPNIVAHGAQLGTLAAMISAGMGISVVPAMMQAHDRQEGCVYRPFAGEPPTRPLTVAWSTFRYRTNAAREFVKLLRKETARS